MRYYDHKLTAYAKQQRKEPTPWERKLWYEFLRGYPVRFQRQRPFQNYIVDFYCARARIVIELDGGGHYAEEQIAYDRSRDKYLASLGFYVLRFTNLEIDRCFRAVCEKIDRIVQERLPQSPVATAPSEREPKSAEGAIP